LSEPQEKPRDLEPVGDPVEIFKFLTEGAKMTASALVWTKDQNKVLNTYVSVVSEVDQVLYIWTPNDFNLEGFRQELLTNGNPHCFFSLSLARANIFFKAEFLTADAGGMKFKIPGKIYKVQRRKNLRFQIPKDYTLSIEFADPLFEGQSLKKKVIDLSAGGLSFQTDTHDSALFQEGLVLKGIRFKIRNHSFEVSGEVRHARPLSSTLLKVGIFFRGMPASETEKIETYVSEESRRFFSRFL
jgi:hypothetical protein